MKPLFNDGNWTPTGQELAREVSEVLKPILVKWSAEYNKTEVIHIASVVIGEIGYDWAMKEQAAEQAKQAEERAQYDENGE